MRERDSSTPLVMEIRVKEESSRLLRFWLQLTDKASTSREAVNIGVQPDLDSIEKTPYPKLPRHRWQFRREARLVHWSDGRPDGYQRSRDESDAVIGFSDAKSNPIGMAEEVVQKLVEEEDERHSAPARRRHCCVRLDRNSDGTSDDDSSVPRDSGGPSTPSGEASDVPKGRATRLVLVRNACDYHLAFEASIARNFTHNRCIACECHNIDGLYSAKQTVVEVELHLEEVLSLIQLGEDCTDFMIYKIKALAELMDSSNALGHALNVGRERPVAGKHPRRRS
ncbi:hypothetical protein VNO77_03949 [Canavalia gladiata]|uniref:Uncharacterized protein n=1 Tax=Canavalia gladiata TaxID=3824 RepID=A0AAN9MWH5_CANGL